MSGADAGGSGSGMNRCGRSGSSRTGDVSANILGRWTSCLLLSCLVLVRYDAAAVVRISAHDLADRSPGGRGRRLRRHRPVDHRVPLAPRPADGYLSMSRHYFMGVLLYQPSGVGNSRISPAAVSAARNQGGPGIAGLGKRHRARRSIRSRWLAVLAAAMLAVPVVPAVPAAASSSGGAVYVWGSPLFGPLGVGGNFTVIPRPLAGVDGIVFTDLRESAGSSTWHCPATAPRTAGAGTRSGSSAGHDAPYRDETSPGGRPPRGCGSPRSPGVPRSRPRSGRGAAPRRAAGRIATPAARRCAVPGDGARVSQHRVTEIVGDPRMQRGVPPGASYLLPLVPDRTAATTTATNSNPALGR
jgi:hypothetical protein